MAASLGTLDHTFAISQAKAKVDGPSASLEVSRANALLERATHACRHPQPRLHPHGRSARGVGASIFILRGTLAPGGAVVKASGIAKRMWQVTLAAKVFKDEEGAIEALRADSVEPGTCVVIRSEGTKVGRECVKCWGRPPRF